MFLRGANINCHVVTLKKKKKTANPLEQNETEYFPLIYYYSVYPKAGWEGVWQKGVLNTLVPRADTKRCCDHTGPKSSVFKSLLA